VAAEGEGVRRVWQAGVWESVFRKGVLTPGEMRREPHSSSH
jgi:hypothetical protein